MVKSAVLKAFNSGNYKRSRISNGELNQAVKKAGYLKGLVNNFLDIVGMVRDVTAGRYKKISKAKLAISIGIIIYVISPIDLIPDFIPLAGYIDDTALVSFAMSLLKNEITNWRSWKNSN